MTRQRHDMCIALKTQPSHARELSCGFFASVFVADLWEVGAPCGVIRPAWPEERPGDGEQLLGGTVGFIRQRSHHHLLGRSPVRTLLTANDQSYCVILLCSTLCHKRLMQTVFLVPFHRRGEDRCLQGLANATISGMTSHTTCMYFVIFIVFFCLCPDSPSLCQCCVMLCGRCMQPKHINKV